MYKIINGDLLEASESIIMQQVCCTATKAHGLSATIAYTFNVNVYTLRKSIGKRNCAVLEDRAIPGTCDVIKIPGKEQYIANLYGQYAMGKPGRYHMDHGIADTSVDRERYFKESLESLYDWCKDMGLFEVAAPYNIGCGLAGGNWTNYIKIFESWITTHPEIKLTLYRI